MVDTKDLTWKVFKIICFLEREHEKDENYTLNKASIRGYIEKYDNVCDSRSIDNRIRTMENNKWLIHVRNNNYKINWNASWKVEQIEETKQQAEEWFKRREFFNE